jgi:hypothetical protein
LGLQPAVRDLSADTDEGVFCVIDAQPLALLAWPANRLPVPQSGSIGRIQPGLGQTGKQGIRWQQQGVAGFGCQGFDGCQ